MNSWFAACGDSRLQVMTYNVGLFIAVLIGGESLAPADRSDASLDHDKLTIDHEVGLSMSASATALISIEATQDTRK